LGETPSADLKVRCKVERAAAELLGQHGERQAVFEVLLDVAAHAAHQGGLRVSVNRLGTAAQAGAITGLFGLLGVVEKVHVFAAGALAGHDGRQKIPVLETAKTKLRRARRRGRQRLPIGGALD